MIEENYLTYRISLGSNIPLTEKLIVTPEGSLEGVIYQKEGLVYRGSLIYGFYGFHFQFGAQLKWLLF